MPEPAGIDISIEEEVTSIAVTSEDAINVAITEVTTSVSVSSVPATTTADSISYEITNEFVPGIYNVDVIFANEKFSAPSFLLLETEIPKLPFWIKDDAKKWSEFSLHSIGVWSASSSCGLGG